MLILHSGNLGAAIAQRLQNRHAAKVADLHEAGAMLEQFLPGQAFVGVAAWRPFSDLFRLIDTACFKYGIRWSSVTLNEFSLNCGPLVVPGRGACYHCYLQRKESHNLASDWERAAQAYYTEHPQEGPLGYPQALVEIGAAALAEDAMADATPARIRSVDVLGAGVQESTVIGIHRCPRCRQRLGAHDPAQRSVEILIPAIKELFNE